MFPASTAPPPSSLQLSSVRSFPCHVRHAVLKPRITQRLLLFVVWGCILLLYHSNTYALVRATEPFDPRRIPVELQAWWTPSFGHIHAGVRVPLGQMVSGTIDVDVRIVLHNNPSQINLVRICAEGDCLFRKNVDLACPYDGTNDTFCAWNIPFELDTTRMQDGWRELRITGNMETPDGNRFFNSSGVPINVQNGTADNNYNRFCGNTSLIGRGWYEGFGYTNAIIECVPLEPIAGVHTFRVRAQKDSGHLTVALDKTHFIPAAGPWPAQPHSHGQILFDKDGDFQNWLPITIDTTTLSDGWHSLAVTSTHPDGDTSVCSYCTNEVNHTAGVAKMWFFVQNGNNADVPVENQQPVVDAGPDQTISLEDEATLQGTVTDDGLPDPPGGVIVTWSKHSGPGTVTFEDFAAVETTGRFSASGTYELALTADDDELIDVDEVTVTVTDDGDTPPPSDSSSIVHAETQSGGSTSTDTVSTAASLTGVSGDLYVAAIATKPHVGIDAVSGLGLHWTLVREQCGGRQATGVSVWMAQGTPSGADKVTATLSRTPKNSVIAVSRYQGAHTATPIGNVMSGNTNGINGACSGGSDSRAYALTMPTTGNGAVVYSAVAMRHRSHTPGADFTELLEIHKGSGGSTAGLALMERALTSSSNVAINGTFNSDVDWAVAAIEIR